MTEIQPAVTDDELEDTGSTLVRRQLGRLLREAREGAGMTIQQGADLMEWGKTTLQKLEKGQTQKVRIRDVLELSRLYGLDDDRVAVVKDLAGQTPAKSWWHTYSDLIPQWANLFVGLEAGATRLTIYQPLLVPGLLQTADYAREIDRRYFPKDTEAALERRAAVRAQRQNILTRSRKPAEAVFVIHETVLATVVGSRGLMAAQLRHLADMSTRENVEVRMVPFDAGIPLGVAMPPFTVLEFGRDAHGRLAEPPLVYCESFTGATYLEEKRDVLRYRQAFRDLQQWAVDARVSLRVRAREYDSEH